VEYSATTNDLQLCSDAASKAGKPDPGWSAGETALHEENAAVELAACRLVFGGDRDGRAEDLAIAGIVLAVLLVSSGIAVYALSRPATLVPCRLPRIEWHRHSILAD
jgi:hypothetical protein